MRFRDVNFIKYYVRVGCVVQCWWGLHIVLNGGRPSNEPFPRYQNAGISHGPVRCDDLFQTFQILCEVKHADSVWLG